jgi:hypothetical protein
MGKGCWVKTFGPREEKQQEDGENYEMRSSKFIFNIYCYSFKVGVTWAGHVNTQGEDEKYKIQIKYSKYKMLLERSRNR